MFFQLETLTSTSMKRQVPRFRFSVETPVANLFVFLTFVIQIIIGSSSQREEHLPVYFQFNHYFENRGIVSSICIGPFRSDVSGNCNFDHQLHVNEMDCFNCYLRDCLNKRNFMDITAYLMAGKNGSTQNNKNLKRFLNTNLTLFVNLENQCTWLKTKEYWSFLEWYMNWCKRYTWPNNSPKCLKTAATKSTTNAWTMTSSTLLPITSFPNFSRSTFLPITHWTETPLEHRQKSNSTTTDFSEQSPNESSFDYKILWVSLGATAVVCTLAVFVILFCQRAKIAKFLRKSENPDVVDDAFYYTDVSMRRLENQSAIDSVTYENVTPNVLLNYTELDFNVQKNLNPENAASEINSTNQSESVTYENVIPNLLHNEPITYVELDFNVHKNSNPENVAAEINSTTGLNQKRDIKGYVDSVIYAELRK
ncbi:uncharacterized protein LOC124208486 [Daphnia pulex]|uniref:uncharacterized protein LOC124208486 n=1 Tax=Daphnia pulex TaxID=6669 RepID=UPI001EE1179C|nr:uncharacterized protein LOC124208486 [Daphnia pulex]